MLRTSIITATLMVQKEHVIATLEPRSVKMSFWGEPDMNSKKDFDIRKYLCTRTITCYVGLGSMVWLVDMHLCDSVLSHSLYFCSLIQTASQLSPKWMGGATFHVIWHLGARYAGSCNQSIYAGREVVVVLKNRLVQFNVY